jgi:hypothetical protein
MSLQDGPAGGSSRFAGRNPGLDEGGDEDPQIEPEDDGCDLIEDGQDDQPGDRRHDPLRRA